MTFFLEIESLKNKVQCLSRQIIFCSDDEFESVKWDLKIASRDLDIMQNLQKQNEDRK